MRLEPVRLFAYTLTRPPTDTEPARICVRWKGEWTPVSWDYAAANAHRSAVKKVTGCTNPRYVRETSTGYVYEVTPQAGNRDQPCCPPCDDGEHADDGTGAPCPCCDHTRVMRRLTTYRHRLAALRDSLTCEDSRDRLSVLVDDLDALLTGEGWAS